MEKMLSQQTAVSHKTVDLSGHRCPHLLIAVIRALDGMPNGRILHVIATDLSAPSNLAAWCRQSGHHLRDMYEENGRFIFYIQKHDP